MAKAKPTTDVETIVRDTAAKALEQHAEAAQRGVNVLGAFDTAEKIAGLLRAFYQSLVAAGVVTPSK